MVQLKILALSAICFLTISAASQSSVQNASPENYTEQITNERMAKDAEFRDPLESPLTKEDIQNFKGLQYYAINPDYHVVADLILENKPDTILMKTTTERLPLYIIYGKAHFTIQGVKDTLTVYRNVGLMTREGYEDYLFVPFTDETSGEESYGGGRYIDSRITNDGKIILDFNRSYNPYCAYNKKYSCPIPPSHNHVDIMIPVGEKNYPK